MSSKSIAGLVVAGLVVFGVGAYVLSGDSTTVDEAIPAPAQVTNAEQRSTDQTPAEQVTTSFTAADVAAHASANDCWTIVDGSVYDITSYVPRHPGGDEILLACGTDGTSLFLQRETTDGQTVGSGTPHSSSAKRQLESFKIGTLTQ